MFRLAILYIKNEGIDEYARRRAMRFITRNYFDLCRNMLTQFQTAVVRARSGCQQASEVRWEHHR